MALTDVVTDAERRQAICDLLLLPDPPDIDGLRGNRITAEGRENRFQQLGYLCSSFIQAKLMEWGRFDFVEDAQVVQVVRVVRKD